MWHGDSAASVSEADRFEWFADVVSTALMPSAFVPQAGVEFHAEGAVLDLGAAQVSRFRYSPLRSKRTPSLIRRGDPEQYQLGLVTKGRAWFAQHGAGAELRAGDMAVWDTSRPYESCSGTDGQHVEVFVLQIPKPALPLPSQRIEPLLAKRIRREAGVRAILSDFLVSLAQNGLDCRPEHLGDLGDMGVELATACLAHEAGLERQAVTESSSRVLLRSINAYVDRHLADPALTPRRIAEHHHISLRALYLLFQEQDEGVAESIRRRRLAHCRADLSRPDQRHRPIEAVAARWGFHSASAFARTFRSAFGVSPSEFRRGALASGDLVGLADTSGRKGPLGTSRADSRPFPGATGAGDLQGGTP